jgi:hypothetical protein
MAMDPKQERALRDGTASEEDLPRRIDKESVREQEENPPVDRRPRGRTRTAAVADVRVNQEAGTPVDQMAREIGAEPVPEMGRAPRNKRNGGTAPETDPAGRHNDFESGKRDARGAQATVDEQRGEETSAEAEEEAPVPPREARRVMKARREHSKGDGNFPSPEPSPQLMDDERPEDREPRDLPKSRDDRSAPKGNVTAGQDERNPNLQTGSDQRPGPPSRAFSLDAARDAAAMPNAAPRARPIAEAKRAGSTFGQVKDAPGRPEKAEKPKADRTPSMPKPRGRTVTKRTGQRPNTTEQTRGTTRRPTNLAKGKGAAVKRAPAKRAVANRATAGRAAPKRGAAKGAAPKRGAAKRAMSGRGAVQRSGTAAHRRTTAKRSASRAKLSR